MKQYNERPSEFKNLGEDIRGAARHRNDTYENPEVTKQKAFKRESKGHLKALLNDYKLKFESALSESTESAQAVLKAYEYRKAVLSCDLLSEFSGTTIEEMRALVLSTQSREHKEILRKTFNRLVTVTNKIRYIRPIELSKYFEPKTRESFTEQNGRKTSWATESKSFDSDSLSQLIRGLQFGNSVPDNERVYIGESLLKSIEILNKYFSIDFKTLAFSFGARGKAGSIAHYQDSIKTLAFNRHWDGALIHELGHAVDYSLGQASYNMPYEIRSKYKAKLNHHKIQNQKYYMDNKEIFARLFEAFCESIMPEITEFMFFPFDRHTLPDLDAESIEWMSTVLKPLLRGES